MSKDGITWSIGNVALVGNASILTADGSGQSISMYYNDVTYGNGVYVIVGGDAYNSPGYGISAQETNMSAWSENGVVWQQTQNMPSKSIWSSVAFGNGVFVAISKRALFQVGTSYNILYNATNGNFNGFSINGETAGRLGREAAVSTNGVDWASSLLPFAGHWTSIVFNGHVFVALCSYSSSYAVSKDGFNWTIRSTGIQGFWNNACVGPSNTVFATSGIAGALPVPGGGIKITESATMVTLPYRKPQDGSNYVVKVK